MISKKLLEKAGLKVKRLSVSSKNKEINKAVNDFVFKVKRANIVTKNSKICFKALSIKAIHTK